MGPRRSGCSGQRRRRPGGCVHNVVFSIMSTAHNKQHRQHRSRVSPCMCFLAPPRPKVYDANDLVLPTMEKDAVFVTTGFFQASPQTRWQGQEGGKHMVCPGMDSCGFLDPTKECPQCAPGTLDDNGQRTGFW